MICVCLSKISFAECLVAAKQFDLVELRLDLLDLTISQIEQICKHRAKVICTYRSGGEVDQKARLDFLQKCLGSGCSYLDLEIEFGAVAITDTINRAKSKGVRVIVSWHASVVPATAELSIIKSQAFELGADIVKIVALAKTEEETQRLLALLQPDRKVIAFAMGEVGQLSRISSLFLGSPFTYVAPDNGDLIAPGQFKYSQALEIYNRLQSLGTEDVCSDR